MRRVATTKSLTAASANCIAQSQSLAGAGPLTLNGSAVSGGVATLDTQRRVIIHSAADDSAQTWTVTGTNEGGAPIKDIFAAANTGDAQSNLDFFTVTSIVCSGATASTVTAGTNTVGSTPWKLVQDTANPTSISLYAQLLSGAASANVEYTYDGILPSAGVQSAIANAGQSPNPAVVLHPQMQGFSASTEGAIDWPITAWRMTILTGTGSFQITARQAGLASN